MNKTRMLVVSDAIENHTIPDLGFNMNFIHEPISEILEHGDPEKAIDRSGFHCKTLACIAGYASAVGGFIPKNRYSTKESQMYLGLTDDEAESLFFNESYAYYGTEDEKFLNVTPKQAASMLRTCVRLDRVISWKEFFDLENE